MSSPFWSPDVLLFGALCLLEAGSAVAFIRWAVTSPARVKRGIWWLLGVTALSTAALLAWRTLLPGVAWQDMVSPEEPAMIPWGRRTFATGFWVASWALPLMPLYALKLLLDDGRRRATEPLRRFRVALGYAPLHLLSVGSVFL
ncbi:hypothetical protein [Deinococcus sp. PEB2-63]